ncbi:MAG: acetolactate synthase small subunit [Syntrophomonadaceae bacterium]|nr:acetolactate synthase small subunit [Syntrophomonadaceae bacterium]
MYNESSRIIALAVQNHPGVMSHITGLFSRRAFNLDGILCGELNNGSSSKIYLLVKNDDGLAQIIKQLEKLHDVIEVSLHDNYDCSLFSRIHDLIKAKV